MTSIMWKAEHARPAVVTGAAGFVGGHVVRALVGAGRRVVATDRLPALPDRVADGLPGAVEYVAGDLRDPGTIDRVLAAAEGRLDVVHVAAVTRFAQLGRALGEDAPTPEEAFASFEVNAVASWRMVSRFAAEERLGRLLHVSTRAVFGGRGAGGAVIAEDAAPEPASVYGASKAAAEVGMLSLRETFGLDLAVVRITGAYGPWQGPVSWLGQVVDHVLRGEPYRVGVGRDDGYELTYVKDTVRGLVGLLDTDRLGHAVYHVSSGEMVTLGSVAAAVRAARPEAVVEFGPGSALGGAVRTPLSGGRLRAETGFAPVWSLGAAVADYLDAEENGTYGADVVAVGS